MRYAQTNVLKADKLSVTFFENCEETEFSSFQPGYTYIVYGIDTHMVYGIHMTRSKLDQKYHQTR